MARALCEWRAVDVSSLAIGWVSVMMWQRVVQHCRRKPAGERQRASRRTQRGSLTLATLAVWCRSWLILSPTWRRWEAFCGNGQPATTSRVAMYIAGSGSPHVADAQVGEIPGFAQQPPPTGVAEMSASGHRLRRGGGADAALRRGIISFIGPIGPMGIFDFSWCKDSGWRGGVRAKCAENRKLT